MTNTTRNIALLCLRFPATHHPLPRAVFPYIAEGRPAERPK